MCVSVYSRAWVSSTKECHICLLLLNFRLFLLAYLAAIIFVCVSIYFHINLIPLAISKAQGK